MRMDAEVERERDAAARNNRDRARSIKDRITRDNSDKELFPSKMTTGGDKAQMDQVNSAESVTKRLSGMSFSYWG